MEILDILKEIMELGLENSIKLNYLLVSCESIAIIYI